MPPRIVLAALLLPALALSSLYAQPAPEYTRVALPASFDDLLRARLLRSPELERIKNSLDALRRFAPDEFDRLQNRVAQQLADPDVTPEQLRIQAEQLQETLRRQLKVELPELRDFKPLPTVIPPDSPVSTFDRASPTPQPQGLPQLGSEADDSLLEMVREMLQDLKDQRWARDLVDSDGFRDFLSDLDNGMDWNSNLSQHSDRLNLPWVPRTLPRVDGNGALEFLRRMPTLSLPDWRVSMPAFSGWNIRMPRMPRFTGRFGGVGSPSGGTAVWIVAWLLVLGALWWTFTKALGRSPLALLFRNAEHDPGRRRLGEMPVSIATREDVIRAFEILAQRQLGDQARMWNHRAVARAWGSGASVTLARIYEMARYTPGDAPLSAADRDAATHAVAQLQGGAA
jgi:hypothetical protein